MKSFAPALCLLAATVSGFGATEFAGVPTGDAASNPETSRAVTVILARCAAAYSGTPSFFAQGKYIEAVKVRDNEEKDSADLEIFFRRPDRLKVALSGKKISTAFLADGTSVTFTSPGRKAYKQIPQPPQLAAFVEEERAGLILDDESRTLTRATAPALLVSDDTLAWLHSNVVKYVFEGAEKLDGADTWRIKFIQADPEIVVTSWIDQQTYLLRKSSVLMAEDSDGGFVESYADAAAARMQIAIFDRTSTMTTRAPKSAFRQRIPANWTDIAATERQKRAGEPESVWQRLFRAAASESRTPTTATVLTDSGAGAFTVAWCHPAPARVAGASKRRATDTTGALVALALTDGTIEVINESGQAGERFRTPLRPDLVAISGTDSGRQIVAAESGSGAVRGFRAGGAAAWSFAGGDDLTDLCPTSDPAGIIVAGARGLQKLGADGQLRFSSREVTFPFSVSPGFDPEGRPALMVLSAGKSVAFYNGDGRIRSKKEGESGIRLIAAGDGTAHPWYALTQGSTPGIQLRGLGRTLQPDWTIGFTQGEKAGVPVHVGKLRKAKGAADEIVAASSNGQIGLFTPSGDPVWRGRVEFSDPTWNSTPKDGLVSVFSSDVNGDGNDDLVVSGAPGVVLLLRK